MQPQLSRRAGLLQTVALVFLLTGLAAPPSHAQAIELSPVLSQLYSSASLYPPSQARIPICYGFGCRLRYLLDVHNSDRAALARIMAAGQSNAAAERAAVQKAVVWLDRRVGPIIGTDKRIANADIRHRADERNFDCLDTTRNVTSLLLVLQNMKLLRHHTVGEPKYRGNALMLQTPHNTAVLIERKNEARWAVDLWTRAYAQMPEVMPVDKWVSLN